jgi:hypothetical protein
VREWIPAVALGALAVLLVAGAAVGITRGFPADPAGERGDAAGRTPPGGPAAAERARYADLRHLATLELPEELEICGQPLPLDDPAVREALEYELLLALGRPMMPLLWLRRAPEHLPRIERTLAEAGLPDDLKYVAVVESDLRGWTESPAGALGLWQIMRATGRRYGLRIDRYLDERLDPERSGEAAMAYLRDLREQFGDWFLALAAYNAGHNGLERTLAEDDTRSYFEIYLPRETRRYVPRIAAAKLIMTAEDHYGLPVLPPPERPGRRPVTVRVEQARTPLSEIAEQHGLGYGVLRRMNPQLISRWLPRGEHRLWLPAGQGAAPDAESP